MSNTNDEVGGKTVAGEKSKESDIKKTYVSDEYRADTSSLIEDIMKIAHQVKSIEDELSKTQEEKDILTKRLGITTTEMENIRTENDTKQNTIETLQMQLKHVQNEMEDTNNTLLDILQQKNKDISEKSKVLDDFLDKDINNQQIIYDLRCNIEDRFLRYRELEQELHQVKAFSTQERKELVKQLERRKEMETANTNENKMLREKNNEAEALNKKLRVLISEMEKQKAKDKIEKERKEKNLYAEVEQERRHVFHLNHLYNELMEQKRSFYEENISLRCEKGDLAISQEAGENLTRNNPNIADLSDEKRPSKLSEIYSEMYDNEWTDAFEDLTYDSEEQKNNFMLEILVIANKLCSDLSNGHGQRIKESLCSLTMPIQTRKTRNMMSRLESSKEVTIKLPAKLLEKATMTDEVDVIIDEQTRKLVSDFDLLHKEQRKTILDAKKFFEIKLSSEAEKAVVDFIVLEKEIDTKKQNNVMAYVEKCANFCWSMCQHEPPVHINIPDVSNNIAFDTNTFKPYTKSGKYIDFIVWPALFLHEGGPLLSKGVAQGKK